MEYVGAVDDGFSLRYSTCNEDNVVELETLHLTPESTVLCITGSTGRVLNLLAGEFCPKKIIALDTNKAQNYLLELKIRAIQKFSYIEYLEFLGMIQSPDRIAYFHRLAPDLSGEARQFWLKHLDRINDGIQFQGRFERFYKFNSVAMKLLFAKKLKGLMACKTLDEQRRFYDEVWNNRIWKLFIKAHSNHWVYKYVLKDPIFYSSVDEGMNREEYVNDVVERLFKISLMRENPMFSLLLFGDYSAVSSRYWPQSMREEYFDKMKSRVHCIEWVHGTTHEYFKNIADKTFEDFSLADIGNCMSSDDFQLLIRDVTRVGKPSARFVVRHSYGRQRIKDQEVLKKIKLFPGKEKEMEQKEKTCGYSLTLGEVL